jgi:hypothetical protein
VLLQLEAHADAGAYRRGEGGEHRVGRDRPAFAGLAVTVAFDPSEQLM